MSIRLYVKCLFVRIYRPHHRLSSHSRPSPPPPTAVTVTTADGKLDCVLLKNGVKRFKLDCAVYIDMCLASQYNQSTSWNAFTKRMNEETPIYLIKYTSYTVMYILFFFLQKLSYRHLKAKMWSQILKWTELIQKRHSCRWYRVFHKISP